MVEIYVCPSRREISETRPRRGRHEDVDSSGNSVLYTGGPPLTWGSLECSPWVLGHKGRVYRDSVKVSDVSEEGI